MLWSSKDRTVFRQELYKTAVRRGVLSASPNILTGPRKEDGNRDLKFILICILIETDMDQRG